jgi:dynein assembly factor 3
LLCGAADIRHVLLTLSRAARWPKRELHFYLLEDNVHTLARHLLFLLIALEPSYAPRGNPNTKSPSIILSHLLLLPALPLLAFVLSRLYHAIARMELWLELYANAMIQEKSHGMLVELIKQLLRLFVSEDGPLATYVDLEHLKYKDRDDIEKVIKWWKNTSEPFDMITYRDTRLRSHTATRYDSRINLYDWDYHMEGIQSVAPIIHLRHYKRWRDSGQAFELRYLILYHTSIPCHAYHISH